MLGRVFEHGKMKQACYKVSGINSVIPPFEKRAAPEDHLRAVAKTFIQAQEQREYADYDVALRWSWMAIRDQPDAQEFLVLLLGPKQRKRPA